MEDSQVLATHIDGKEDRLTMEFSCAQGRGIKRLKGVVGMVRQEGIALDKTSAHVEHVHELLHNLCTGLHGAPPRADGSIPESNFSRSYGNLI